MSNCDFDQELTLDDFSRNALEYMGNSRYPLSGTIELTPRCSVNCLHCYINEAAGNQEIRAKELTTSQWKDILDQLEAAGTFFLMITGGEPLLRPDFDEIFQYSRKKGMIVTLFSNGTLLTKEKAQMLSEWNLENLEMSIYGGTEETYEKVTRTPGSFNRFMNGIRNALDAGLKLSLKTVVLKENLHELELMKEITENFGLKFRYDGSIWPRLNGDRGPLEHQVPAEIMLAFDKNDQKRKEAWEKTRDIAGSTILRNNKVFACNASTRNFHIDSFGNLNACMMLRSIHYNVLELGFIEAWERMGSIHKMKRSRPSPCPTCDATAFCVQCPALSYAFFGDYETISEPICSTAKQRKILFNKTLIDII
jgi:radical SAM protein with 4Fe4S-binding SPASM domain